MVQPFSAERSCPLFCFELLGTHYPIGSMYAIYGNIYHQYTPNVSIYIYHTWNPMGTGASTLSAPVSRRCLEPQVGFVNRWQVMAMKGRTPYDICHQWNYMEAWLCATIRIICMCIYTYSIIYIYIYYICIIPFVEAVEHVISFLLSDTIVAEGWVSFCGIVSYNVLPTHTQSIHGAMRLLILDLSWRQHLQEPPMFGW